jgi:hypothetical protein
VQELNHRPSRCLIGRRASAVVPDDAQQVRWTLRQRQTIFRLLFPHFGQMIGGTAKEYRPRAAAWWRLTVETWLRRQGLISARQNENAYVSPTCLGIWSQN